MISSWSMRRRPRALPLNPSLSPLSCSHPHSPLLVCHITGRVRWRSPAAPQSELFVHLLQCASPHSLLRWGQDFSWNTKWCHLPAYFEWNGLWLPLYLKYSYLSSIINCSPVVYQISSVSFASYYFYSPILSISSPPFFLISGCFPLK